MKKTTSKEAVGATVDDEFKQVFHHTLSECNDEMERKELKVYINDENQPKIKELNDSDVSVGDVLTVGAYMVLDFLHHKLHEHEAVDVQKQIDDMFDGKVSFRDIVPDGLPEEVKDLLEGLVDSVKSSRKKRGEK